MQKYSTDIHKNRWTK